VAVGLLNADAKPDLVVSNVSTGSVTIMIGVGDGTFGPVNTMFTGGGPGAVAIGDLNGDGKADVAIAGTGANAVMLLIGNGNGTFGSGPVFPTGDAPDAVAIADLNGDGKKDLAVLNGYGNTLSVLIGKGNGTFAPKRDFSTGNLPLALAVGDLNGDGRLDVTIANANVNSVSVLLNTGGVAYLGVDPPPSGLAATFRLLSPRPNPSRGASEIRFVLPAARAVRLEVFDLGGRRVRTLASGAVLAAGPHAITWDGRDESGARLAGGVFILRAQAGAESSTRKLVLQH
jgi:hypothetical protein